MLTEKETKRLLDVAITGLNKGEVNLARVVFEGILMDQPEHAPALIAQALSYAVVGEYERAEVLLREKVLAKNPNDPDALAYLGMTLSFSGHKDEAEEVLRQVPADSSAAKLAQELLDQLNA